MNQHGGFKILSGSGLSSLLRVGKETCKNEQEAEVQPSQEADSGANHLTNDTETASHLWPLTKRHSCFQAVPDDYLSLQGHCKRFLMDASLPQNLSLHS